MPNFCMFNFLYSQSFYVSFLVFKTFHASKLFCILKFFDAAKIVSSSPKFIVFSTTFLINFQSPKILYMFLSKFLHLQCIFCISKLFLSSFYNFMYLQLSTSTSTILHLNNLCMTNFLQVQFFVFPKCLSIIFVFTIFSSSELLYFYFFDMPEMVLSPNFLHFQKINFSVIQFFISPNMLCLYIFS